MRRVLVARLPAAGDPAQLDRAEAKHLFSVLRLENGDQVEAMDGSGRAVVAGLRRSSGGRAELVFVAEATRRAGEVVPVSVEIALLKPDAMAWAVEKCVELGVERLLVMTTERSVPRPDSKGPKVVRDRLQRVADQSLKQCGRRRRLEVEGPLPLSELLEARKAEPARPRLWCDEAAEGAVALRDLCAGPSPLLGSPAIAEVRLLVGPEGGWTRNERELLARAPDVTRVTLGPNVLRAETAALFAASWVTGTLRAALTLTGASGDKVSGGTHL